jgi:hypothetical protein
MGTTTINAGTKQSTIVQTQQVATLCFNLVREAVDLVEKQANSSPFTIASWSSARDDGSTFQSQNGQKIVTHSEREGRDSNAPNANVASESCRKGAIAT